MQTPNLLFIGFFYYMNDNNSNKSNFNCLKMCDKWKYHTFDYFYCND